MTVEAFPPLATAPVDLDEVGPDNQLRAEKASQLKDRVEFGGPLVTPIDEKYHPDDAELQAYVRGRSDQLRFVLAHMSVNFPFSQDGELLTAGVSVSLTDDGTTGQTVAYSLFPTRAGTAYELTRGYELAPNLTVGGVSASPGSITHNTVDHGTRDYILGGPEASATPRWTFEKTDVQQLTGSARLVMVIQIPIGRTGSVSVDLSATMEQGRWRKHRIPLPGADEANPQAVFF